MTKPANKSGFTGSVAKRRIECPASMRLERAFPDKDTEYSLEGSVAHRTAEKAKKAGKPAAWYIGRDCLLENGHNGKTTAEMAENVQIYLDEIARLESFVGAPATLEMPLIVSSVGKDLTGTADCVVVDDLMGTAFVGDLKYGAGVTVEVEGNTQLMFYGCGVLDQLDGWGKFVEVVLWICQPRGHHPAGPVRSWCVSVADLEKWRDEVLRPAYRRCKHPDAPAIPGDHCRFCKAVSVCPGIRKAATESAMMTFEKAGEVPADPTTLDPEAIGRICGYAEAIRGWLDAVEDRARSVILAGGKVPGFKVVQARTNRRWSDEAAALTFLVSVLGDAGQKVAPITPAQAEKALKGIAMTVPDSFITRPAGGPVLASADDKRPEFQPVSAIEAFDDQKGEPQ